MPIRDEDLISILRKEEQVAQNWQDKELLALRQKALDYYDRNVVQFGQEEGQSQVVTSEFADTVESVMPGMMRVFAGGADIVTFSPREEPDEEWAKQASQYVPHVFMRENDGFRIIYWFIKDALMYRLATATVDTEEVEKTEKKPLAGYTQEEMDAAEEMAKEKGFTDITFEVEKDPPAPPPPTIAQGAEAAMAQGPGPGLWAPMAPTGPTFSGTATLTKRRKRVVIDNVASEDLLVSPGNTRDIDQASYVGYRKQTTNSALRELGIKQDKIDSLSANRTSSPEEDQRQDGQPDSNNRKDDQRRLWLVVAYVKADDDGDGISEMIRVVYAHAGGVNGAIVERTPWEDGEAPITIGSVIMMSHTIVGRSLFDQTQDLQEVGTVLTRGLLDNLYQTNRPRPLINGRVNINSVLDHTPGMPVTMQGNENPANNISYLQVPSIISPALEALGYLENKRDQRTGTSRIGNNMDSDALSDASKMTKGGTSMVMSVAQERQELMANVLAQTAFSRLMRHVYRAIKRNAEGPVKYYANDSWQECDPTKWPDDMHLIVNVGTSNKQQEQMNLMGVGAAQEKIGLAQGGFNGPVVTLEHIANTGRKLAEASGYRASSQFFASSKDVQKAVADQAAKGPQVPPEVQAEQAKAQGVIQMEQAKTQGAIQVQAAQNEDAMRQMQAEAAVKLQEQQGEAQLKQIELTAKQREQQQAAEVKAAEINLKHEELRIKQEELAVKRMELENKKHELNMNMVSSARDQYHERQMARAKTPNGAADGLTDEPGATDANQSSLADSIRGHMADQSGHADTLRQHLAGLTEAVASLAQSHQQTAQAAATAHAQSTAHMAQAIQSLAHAHMAESEITGPSGKTYRARKVPRGN